MSGNKILKYLWKSFHFTYPSSVSFIISQISRFKAQSSDAKAPSVALSGIQNVHEFRHTRQKNGHVFEMFRKNSSIKVLVSLLNGHRC